MLANVLVGLEKEEFGSFHDFVVASLEAETKEPSEEVQEETVEEPKSGDRACRRPSRSVSVRRRHDGSGREYPVPRICFFS
jgi:hypothetical protein